MDASIFEREENGKLRIAEEGSTASWGLQGSGLPAVRHCFVLEDRHDAFSCGRLHAQALSGCHA